MLGNYAVIHLVYMLATSYTIAVAILIYTTICYACSVCRDHCVRTRADIISKYAPALLADALARYSYQASFCILESLAQ